MSVLGPAPRSHMYVDESTQRDYLVMCAVVTAHEAPAARKHMRSLLLPGQRSLHMKNEKRRAPQILDAIGALVPQILIISSRGTPDLQARETCLKRLAREACLADVSRMVLDRVGDAESRDRSWLISGARDASFQTPPFSYSHQSRHEEPLLWIADSVGWAWQRGGELREVVRPWTRLIEL